MISSKIEKEFKSNLITPARRSMLVRTKNSKKNSERREIRVNSLKFQLKTSGFLIKKGTRVKQARNAAKANIPCTSPPKARMIIKMLSDARRWKRKLRTLILSILNSSFGMPKRQVIPKNRRKKEISKRKLGGEKFIRSK